MLLPPTTIQAIQSWLALAPTSPDVAQLQSDPLSFFARHLDLLSPHLVALLGASLSSIQRGSLARIRTRRSRYLASLDTHEWLEEARGREPLLCQQLTSSSSSLLKLKQRPQATQRRADTLIQPDQVDAQPQFQRLMSTIDQGERKERLARQQAKLDEVRGEIETDSEEEEEEEEENETGQDAFEKEIKRRFIWGDVSLSVADYTCDFEERWDDTNSPPPQEAPRATVSVPRALNDEDRWFDDEEES